MKMIEPKVTEEVTYSTIETSSKNTTTNRRILSNTWIGNAVELNTYDNEGNLRSSETDKQSWQDHHTQFYQWSDKDPPPDMPPSELDKVEPLGASKQQTTTQITSDGNIVMLKSTELSSTPVVHWSGQGVSRSSSSNQNLPIDMTSQNGVTSSYDEGEGKKSESSTKENMEGSKWSRTEETVWMTSNKRINPVNSLAAVQGGVDSAKKAESQALSIEERKRLRRNAAKAMTAERNCVT